MRQIALTAEDFDTLDTESRCFDAQYLDNEDCPIYRSLTRAGHRVESVDPFYLKLKDGRRIDGKMNFEEVERCANELRAGAKVAIIKL